MMNDEDNDDDDGEVGGSNSDIYAGVACDGGGGEGGC